MVCAMSACTTSACATSACIKSACMKPSPSNPSPHPLHLSFLIPLPTQLNPHLPTHLTPLPRRPTLTSPSPQRAASGIYQQKPLGIPALLSTTLAFSDSEKYQTPPGYRLRCMAVGSRPGYTGASYGLPEYGSGLGKLQRVPQQKAPLQPRVPKESFVLQQQRIHGRGPGVPKRPAWAYQAPSPYSAPSRYSAPKDYQIPNPTWPQEGLTQTREPSTRTAQASPSLLLTQASSLQRSISARLDKALSESDIPVRLDKALSALSESDIPVRLDRALSDSGAAARQVSRSAMSAASSAAEAALADATVLLPARALIIAFALLLLYGGALTSVISNSWESFIGSVCVALLLTASSLGPLRIRFQDTASKLLSAVLGYIGFTAIGELMMRPPKTLFTLPSYLLLVFAFATSVTFLHPNAYYKAA